MTGSAGSFLVVQGEILLVGSSRIPFAVCYGTVEPVVEERVGWGELGLGVPKWLRDGTDG
jgi:hypothetical protein